MHSLISLFILKSFRVLHMREEAQVLHDSSSPLAARRERAQTHKQTKNSVNSHIHTDSRVNPHTLTANIPVDPVTLLRGKKHL